MAAESSPKAQAQATLPPQAFSVAVFGAMNPAIHHPLWYSHHELLGGVELQEALSPPFTCTPIFAKFIFSGFQVVCQSDRWEITASGLGDRSRMRAIARRLFDDLLAQTPVSRVTCQNAFHKKTTAVDVKAALSGLTQAGGLTVGRDLDSVNLLLNAHRGDDSSFHIRIEPSLRSLSEIFVSTTVAHPTPQQPGFSFSLGPLLDRFFDRDFADAEDCASHLVAAIDMREKESRP